jgi:hypothetical protein
MVKLYLRFASFGKVTRDLGEADQVVIIIVYGIDHNACPETAAILPAAPPFGFEASFAAGRIKCPLGHARIAILWRVEAGKVLTDNFGLWITLDACGACIPVNHLPFRAQHVDGVVG